MFFTPTLILPLPCTFRTTTIATACWRPILLFWMHSQGMKSMHAQRKSSDPQACTYDLLTVANPIDNTCPIVAQVHRPITTKHNPYRAPHSARHVQWDPSCFR